jgi:hypothetical protein
MGHVGPKMKERTIQMIIKVEITGTKKGMKEFYDNNWIQHEPDATEVEKRQLYYDRPDTEWMYRGIYLMLTPVAFTKTSSSYLFDTDSENLSLPEIFEWLFYLKRDSGRFDVNLELTMHSTDMNEFFFKGDVEYERYLTEWRVKEEKKRLDKIVAALK